MRRLLVAIAVAVLAVGAVLLARGGESRRPAVAEREAQATPIPTATPQASIEPAGISEHLRALRDAARRRGHARRRLARRPRDRRATSPGACAPRGSA